MISRAFTRTRRSETVSEEDLLLSRENASAKSPRPRSVKLPDFGIKRFLRRHSVLKLSKEPIPALLGTGSSSRVYQHGPHQVIKVSNRCKDLYHEHQRHKIVSKSFSFWRIHLSIWLGKDLTTRQKPQFPRVPAVHGYTPDISVQPGCGDIIKDPELMSWRKAGIFMERVEPLGQSLKRILVETYLDPSIRELALEDPENEHFLLRPFFGVETSSSLSTLNPSLHDRPVYLDELIKQLGKREVDKCMAKLGVALAIIHWDCEMDARGIKIVIGQHKHGRPTLWLLDFGDMRPFARTEEAVHRQLVPAVACNRRFFPRPGVGPLNMQSWSRFRMAYWETSQAVLLQKKASYGQEAWLVCKNLRNLFMSALKDYCQTADNK